MYISHVLWTVNDKAFTSIKSIIYGQVWKKAQINWYRRNNTISIVNEEGQSL
jgi:hypothetical protein